MFIFLHISVSEMCDKVFLENKWITSRHYRRKRQKLENTFKQCNSNHSNDIITEDIVDEDDNFANTDDDSTNIDDDVTENHTIYDEIDNIDDEIIDNHTTDDDDYVTTYNETNNINDDMVDRHTTHGDAININAGNEEHNDYYDSTEDRLIALGEVLKNHNASRDLSNDILAVLKTFDARVIESLPTDVRSLPLRQKKLLVPIKTMLPGLYAYIGIQYNFECKLTSQMEDFAAKKKDEEILSVGINIDGLPLFHSSNKVFWPILGKFEDAVFLIALYFGEKKPSNVNEFLQDFINECIQLTTEGLVWQNRHFGFKISHLVCDAPAKSYVLQTKGHTGYGSCSKCVTSGTYINNRICFPQIGAARRNDTSFRNQFDLDHHIGITDFLKIPNFDIVNDVPLDYMHLICLGCMKRLISLWLEGPLSIRISSNTICRINEKIKLLYQKCPSDFQRKPRSLMEIKLWKSTELRQFLMYTGIVVLKGELSDLVYENFLYLHAATRILCDVRSLNEETINVAKDLNMRFIRTFKILYGAELVSHNIHGLQHLHECVQRFGTLDEFSSFPFESFLYQLKRMVSSGNRPLVQVINKYCESYAPPKKKKNSNSKGKIDADGDCIYKRYYINGHLFKINDADVYCGLSSGEIIEITCIYKDNKNSDRLMVVGKKFKKIQSFYVDEMIDSKEIGIFKLSASKHSQQIFPAEMIDSKYYLLPYKDANVAVRLLHCV